MYFVEGMADGRFPVVTKVHHALADGVASANLLARAMDLDGPTQDEREPSEAEPAPSRGELVRTAIRDHLQEFGKMPRLIKETAEGVFRVRRRSKERGDRPEMARGFSPPPTFINHVVSPGRRFASATLALADVKETSKQLGVTINDMVLATAAGALRELLLRYDGRADEPIIGSVPASLDMSPDRLTGNELSGMNISLPVQVDDPLGRVRLTGLASSMAKEDFRLLGPRVVMSWVAYLPPAVTPAAFRWLSKREAPNKLLNVPISSVPGPRERGHVAAATIGEWYSVGPLVAGSGMNITVCGAMSTRSTSRCSPTTTP
jgi:WS/DGAT/MGAT family acyltransferase